MLFPREQKSKTRANIPLDQSARATASAARPFRAANKICRAVDPEGEKISATRRDDDASSCLHYTMVSLPFPPALPRIPFISLALITTRL